MQPSNGATIDKANPRMQNLIAFVHFATVSSVSGPENSWQKGAHKLHQPPMQLSWPKKHAYADSQPSAADPAKHAAWPQQQKIKTLFTIDM